MSQPSPSLVELHLTFAGNGLEDEDLCALAECFGQFANLTRTVLDLQANTISDKGFDNLLCCFKSLPNLDFISMDLRNNLSVDRQNSAILPKQT